MADISSRAASAVLAMGKVDLKRGQQVGPSAWSYAQDEWPPGPKKTKQVDGVGEERGTLCKS